MKLLLSLTFFVILINAQAQIADTSFESIAEYHSQAMVNAYEIKSTAKYHQHLDSFLVKYNSLSDQQKAYYSGYLLNAYYNLACTYALIGNKSKALDYLELSKYTDYQHLLDDPDLTSIRGEKRFAKCLKYAQSQSPDYLGLLKKAKTYKPVSPEEIVPSFSYQSSNDPNLMALRQKFNLDSIAGYGNEVSRVLNLLHWIHQLIPHDGNHPNPEIRNAESMIAVCQKENRGLNCRGLAIALNECYLALGIPSRYVTCLPKDSSDQDCHVINMVYINALNKWIWIDPTWDAYIMNEKGELLGIEEVRERLISGKPLILNPDANWNRRNSATKEAYLYQYMAKNLYRFECPANSEYDYETVRKDNKRLYYSLNPADYHSLLPYEIARQSRPQFRVVFTNNVSAFWDKPK